VSAATATTINHAIIDDLTARSNEPAVLAHPGGSRQGRMLPPTGQPSASAGARQKSVSASGDSHAEAFRSSRFSSGSAGEGHLACVAASARSGDLGLVTPSVDYGEEATSQPSARGNRLRPIDRAPGCGLPKAAEAIRPCPFRGLPVTPIAQNTSDAPTRSGRPVAGTPEALACFSLRAGEGGRPHPSVAIRNSCLVPVARDASRSARPQGVN